MIWRRRRRRRKTRGIDVLGEEVCCSSVREQRKGPSKKKNFVEFLGGLSWNNVSRIRIYTYLGR